MRSQENQLLVRAKSGDKDALSALLLEHGPRIRDSLDINPKWRSVLERDDVMQVTYFEAFEQITRFSGNVAAFTRWLHRIAENNLKDAIQGLQREKRPQPDQRVSAADETDSMAWLFEALTGSAATPSRHAMGNETRNLLESEIEKLPTDYGNVVRWMFLEGKPVGEVAERMARTRGAIHLLRIRAVNRLRERLGSGSRFFSYQ